MWFKAKAWADRVCIESPRWQLSCARDTYHEPGHLLVSVEARIEEMQALRTMIAQDKAERIR